MAVEGKLRYSSWEREGRRRSKIEVIVDDLELMSSRHRDGQPQPEPAQWPAEMPVWTRSTRPYRRSCRPCTTRTYRFKEGT